MEKADYLWHAAEGDPLSPTSTVRRCPLSDDGIQQAFQLVLRKACGMPAEFAKRYTKHSARKLMVTRGKWPLSSGVGRAPPLTNRYSCQQRMPGASVRLRSCACQSDTLPMPASSGSRGSPAIRSSGWLATYELARVLTASGVASTPKATCLAITQYGMPCRSMMPNPRACSSTPLLAYMNFLVDFLFGPFGMIGTMGQVAGAAHSPSA